LASKNLTRLFPFLLVRADYFLDIFQVVDRIKNNNFFKFIKSIFLTLVFIMVLLAGATIDLNKVQWLSARMINPEIENLISLVNIDEYRALNLFKDVNISLAGQGDVFPVLADYFNKELPESLMIDNMQALATVQNKSGHDLITVEDQTQIPDLPEREEKKEVQGNYQKIFAGYNIQLYCTHSGESYIPSSSAARLEGKKGLIMNVADHIAESLKLKGMEAVFIDDIHDYPDFNKSYVNSRETIKKNNCRARQKSVGGF
jgi:stage II sporulation protein P